MNSILDEARNGTVIHKDMDVELPIFGKARIYGLIPYDSNPLTNIITSPPLGKAIIIANRCLFELNGKIIQRFPIFSSVSIPLDNVFPVYLLYVPRLLNNSKNPSHVEYYISAYKSTIYNCNVSRLDDIHISEYIAYYTRKEDELLFKSSSELSGMGNAFMVITYRENTKTGEILYETYNAQDITLSSDNHKKAY